MKVWVLQHERSIDDGDDVKLVGIYASEADAVAARLRSKACPGFREHPDGFSIDGYEVGQDHWQDGFDTASGVSKEEPSQIARRARAS